MNFNCWQEIHEMVSERGQSKQTTGLVFQASLENADNKELFETIVNFQILFYSLSLFFFPEEQHEILVWKVAHRSEKFLHLCMFKEHKREMNSYVFGANF